MITVNPDGTFSPAAGLSIRGVETVEWVGLGRLDGKIDAIVQIADPASDPAADPCGVADATLHAAHDPANHNEVTGPNRKGVSGIWVLGPNDAGYQEVDPSTACLCETPPNGQTPCVPLVVDAAVSVDGLSHKLCPKQGPPHQILESTWTNPDITGVILRFGWSALQIDNNGKIEFDFAALDHEMDMAAAHGKLFTLDISAGDDGTPKWIFDGYKGPAGSKCITDLMDPLLGKGCVPLLSLRDWGSDDSKAPAGCGSEIKLGSPTNGDYQTLYLAMIRELADHVRSDTRWYAALAHVKASGANLFSSEARLPNRCEDADGDGVLDPNCICNTKVWADAGYTPEGLYGFYRAVENAIYTSFSRDKSIGYQLIQAGFPRVSSPTNFLGDTLLDQMGNPLCPDGTCTAADDIDGVDQTEAVLEQGRLGWFHDPTALTDDETAGGLFVVQHSGIGRLPEDDHPASPCTVNADCLSGACRDGVCLGCAQSAIVDEITEKADFSIEVKPSSDAGCPNKWAAEQGITFDQITGFQTNNDKEIASPEDVESALWNLTINSKAVYIELYEDRVWEIRYSRGMGKAAAPLDPGRLTRGGPAPYTKNLSTWGEELHERRRELVAGLPTGPKGDPFPTSWKVTFSNSHAETIHFINPARCAMTNDPARVGVIRIVP